MDFVQVMKDWRRMCQYMVKEYGNGSCDKCPLGGCSAVYEMCGKETFLNMERDIVAWAAEHPEPVYPTWGEWFVEHGDLVDGWQNATNAAWMANHALEVFMNPIPADIAEKLDIEPKEG